MKKILFILGVCIFSSVSVATIARAADVSSVGISGSQSSSYTQQGEKKPIAPLENPLGARNMSITDIVLKFMKIVSYVAVIFGVLMLIWTGLQFVLAQGNAEKIKEKSNQLLWVMVGIGVILGARVLVSVVINTISATGAADSAVIQGAKDAVQKSQ